MVILFFGGACLVVIVCLLSQSTHTNTRILTGGSLHTHSDTHVFTPCIDSQARPKQQIGKATRGQSSHAPRALLLRRFAIIKLRHKTPRDTHGSSRSPRHSPTRTLLDRPDHSPWFSPFALLSLTRALTHRHTHLDTRLCVSLRSRSSLTKARWLCTHTCPSLTHTRNAHLHTKRATHTHTYIYIDTRSFALFSHKSAHGCIGSQVHT